MVLCRLREFRYLGELTVVPPITQVVTRASLSNDKKTDYACSLQVVTKASCFRIYCLLRVWKSLLHSVISLLSILL